MNGRNGHSLDVPAALYASDDFARQVFEFLRSLPFFLRAILKHSNEPSLGGGAARSR
jgi:hypothetical protein